MLVAPSNDKYFPILIIDENRFVVEFYNFVFIWKMSVPHTGFIGFPATISSKVIELMYIIRSAVCVRRNDITQKKKNYR